MHLIRYTGPNDWSALYVDGQLETVGDHYLVEERIAELCGIELREGDTFLLGQHEKNKAAQTIEEIQDYEEQLHDFAAKEASEKSARSLRETAADLLRQAEELENRYILP